MNWVWENRAWIFSGVGVSIIVAALWVFRRFFLPPSPSSVPSNVTKIESSSLSGSPVATGSNISQTVQITNISNSESKTVPRRKFTRPTPDEITKQLNQLTDYQKPFASKAYEQIPVYWPVLFDSLFTRQGDDECRVVFTHANDKPHFSQIFCDGIKLSDYPRLKLAREGDRMELSGTILGVDIFACVFLKDVKLIFPEP